MNFEESNSYQEEIEKRDRKKKIVMLSIVLCGIFTVLLFILILVITYQDSITEKFFIDGVQTTKLDNTLYAEINGTTYIDIKTLSSVLGYSYTKGDYKKYNEREESCYIQNDFEIVALASGKTIYDKYLELSPKTVISNINVTSKNPNGYSENFSLDNPIVYQDGKIYVPLESIPKMLNVTVDWKDYRKKIYTLGDRVKKAQTAITKAGFAEMSGYYENLRAILDGYVIIGDFPAGTPKNSSKEMSKYYGVYSLNKNAEVISIKYDEITYIQNVEEFYIKVEDGTMGMLNSEGGTIVAPSEFTQITLLDKDKKLYLVKKGQEYGVVDRTGKTIIFPENDEIGLNDNYLKEYTLEDIDNPKMLFGKCIPTKKDGKFGLYNSEGTMVLNFSYETLGYKSTATSKTSGNEQSVLLIPPSVGIKGIVINKDDMYGIFDVKTEKIILPCVYSKVYAITKNGKTTYYIDFNGVEIDLKDYLESQGLNNVTVNEDGSVIEKADEPEEEEKEKVKDNSRKTTSEDNKKSTNTVDEDSRTSTETDAETESNNNVDDEVVIEL